MLKIAFRIIIVAAFVAAPSFVCAASPTTALAGELELKAVAGALTGSAGLWVALLVFLWGFWRTFVQSDSAAGVLMMVGAILLTVFPGIFNIASGLIVPVISSATGMH